MGFLEEVGRLAIMTAIQVFLSRYGTEAVAAIAAYEYDQRGFFTKLFGPSKEDFVAGRVADFMRTGDSGDLMPVIEGFVQGYEAVDSAFEVVELLEGLLG